MNLFYWKHQVPILSPNDITVFNVELTKLLRIKILIILRMRVTTNEIAYI